MIQKEIKHPSLSGSVSLGASVVSWRDGREAEGAPLLREYRANNSIEGSNPSLSAILMLEDAGRHHLTVKAVSRALAVV